MSLIHQKLYQTDDVKTIDMCVYLHEFVRYLDESFGTHGRIQYRLDIEAIHLGVSQAIPIALIINEAVTNSIKYAYCSRLQAIIDICMDKTGNEVTLIIADNGVGLEEAVANAPGNSLGLKLIKGLTGDISGSVCFSNKDGTVITIKFVVDLFHSDDGLHAIEQNEVYA